MPKKMPEDDPTENVEPEPPEKADKEHGEEVSTDTKTRLRERPSDEPSKPDRKR